jgi:hypothetical protein
LSETAVASPLAEFSQASWLKTTNPISSRPSVRGKRLKENVNPGSHFGNLLAFQNLLILNRSRRKSALDEGA